MQNNPPGGVDTSDPGVSAPPPGSNTPVAPPPDPTPPDSGDDQGGTQTAYAPGAANIPAWAQGGSNNLAAAGTYGQAPAPSQPTPYGNIPGQAPPVNFGQSAPGAPGVGAANNGQTPNPSPGSPGYAAGQWGGTGWGGGGGNSSMTPVSYTHLATIWIDGTAYTVSTVNSPTDLTLSATAGVQQGAYWQAFTGANVTALTGAYIDGYFVVQRPSGYPFQGVCTTFGSGIASWVSGPTFNNLSLGDGIAINGVGYTVAAIFSSHSITVTPNPGSQITVAFGFGQDTGRQFNISAPDDGESWDPLD